LFWSFSSLARCKKIKMKLVFSLSCFLMCLLGFSQTPSNQEKIKTLLQDYFRLDREIIHVQFSKTSYLNNEDLVFKGYVLNKNTNLPYNSTSNIQLVVYDEQEQIVQKQLLYASNGTFSGGIHLNNKFKTGKYQFHFYTNWMNNFIEDDSFNQTIDISNIEEPYYFQSKEPNWKTITIDFFPEGGNIIEGINNTIGVKITDCNNKGVELDNILVLDSKSNEIHRFTTNKMGNGTFYLIADINEKYSLEINSEKLKISKELPLVKPTGIAISYNNNLPKNILAVEIKTNDRGVELFQNKKFNLLIQQNGSSILKEINFSNQEKGQTILIEKKYLPNGVNFIRLLDEDLNEVSSRLIYNYANIPSETNIKAKIAVNDSIALSGTTAGVGANISASILPQNTICRENKRSILGTYYLNAYLATPEIDNYAYFDPDNKLKKRDMDLLMLNQRTNKYLWHNIKSNPPKMNYKFNKGVTISGNINRPLTPTTSNTVMLMSLKDHLFEKTAVEKDNSFKFENFFVQDSTVYLLQLENEKKGANYTKMVAKAYNNETKFNLPIQFLKTNCPLEKKIGDSIIFSASNLKGTTLREVTLINKYKKDIFTHKPDMGINTRAFKISDIEFGNVLDFIGRNGYRTGIDPEENTIYIRSNRSIMGRESPAVFVDDFQLFDYNFLVSINMSSVDEIYIDQSGFSDTSLGNTGTIKIYLKTGSEEKYYKTKLTTLVATGGFSKNFIYNNSNFDNQKEFYSFGTLNWTPTIQLKENSNFEIKFPKGNQTEIQVVIEGFTNDGQLISEIRKLPVDTMD
jgi:hypothetical protein